jgi:glycosyltransferase involved in cell wall biosynthesis
MSVFAKPYNPSKYFLYQRGKIITEQPWKRPTYSKVKEFLFDEKYFDCIQFSLNKIDRKTLNFLYNIADVQILLTSNEGWGLTLTESMLCGTPIIANVTGGMQDQKIGRAHV